MPNTNSFHKTHKAIYKSTSIGGDKAKYLLEMWKNERSIEPFVISITKYLFVHHGDYTPPADMIMVKITKWGKLYRQIFTIKLSSFAVMADAIGKLVKS